MRTYIVSEWRSIAEAAAELGVHPQTIRRWVKEGSLPAFRLRQHGPLRLHVDDLRDLFAPYVSSPDQRTQPGDVPRTPPLMADLMRHRRDKERVA